MKLYILLGVMILLSACSMIEMAPEDRLPEEEIKEAIEEAVENYTDEVLIVDMPQKLEDEPVPETEPEPVEEEPVYEGKTHEVVIKDLTVTPKILTITVGDTVVFKIQDKVSIKLSGSVIKPPILYYGDEYKMKFERTGIFPYTDEFHGGISGEIHVKGLPIIVQDPVEEPEGIHFVNIQGYQYIPQTITVKKGDIVIWEAFDATAQTVDGAGFSSGPLRKGDKFHHTFNQTGIFPYGSIFRSNMLGTVIVEE